MKTRREILEIRSSNALNVRGDFDLVERPALRPNQIQTTSVAPAPAHRPASESRATIRIDSENARLVRGASFRFGTDDSDVFML